MATFTPYKKRPAHKTVGLVRIDGDAVYVEQEEGWKNASVDVSSCDVLYCARDTVRSFLRRGIGSAVRREATIIRWEIDGRSIHILPRDIEPSLSDLLVWRDWVESEGAGIGSRLGTAVSLLRATLEAEFSTSGDRPPIPVIIGGRMHATAPAMHPRVDVWDMRSAYASTLAQLPGGKWRKSRLNLDDIRPQFAECSVFVPMRGAGWGPLPQREGVHVNGAWWEEWVVQRPYPQGVTLAGIWSGDELRSAEKHGGRIRNVTQAWRMTIAQEQPFRPWGEAVERGRKLKGIAASLAKVTGNTLWGVFAVRPGALERISYVDGRMVRVALPDSGAGGYHRDFALAETITARVRARVYDELIVPASDRLVSVCVDGGLVKPGFRPQSDDWRKKDTGELCAFITPYLYMYRQPNGDAVFKAAGVHESKRMRFFDSMHRSAYGESRTPARLRLRRALDGSALEGAIAENLVIDKLGAVRIIEGDAGNSRRKGRRR